MDKKLTVTGIIVEYNPFHNGHIYHINKAKEITKCDVLIAVMSPQFVQRGEPAFINKFDRTEAALNAGVDIIIELPTYYALQAADHFAKAAITLLQLMEIDHLVYGVEDLDITPNSFDSDSIKQGHSYAKAFQSSNSTPNNILALAYEAIIANTSIKGHRIKRTNDYLGTNIDSSISSATAIRKAHTDQLDTSHTTPMTFNITHQLEDYDTLIRYALISQTPDQLREYLLVAEGIEHLFKKHENLPLNDLIEACISARYTRSRIKRTLLNILLGHRKDTPASLSQARVLGFNTNGQTYLKQIKNDAVKYTTSFKNYFNKDLEINATQIYTLVKSKETQDNLFKQELLTPIRIK